MHLMICVDENGGMLFNSRRQSRDRILCEKIADMTASSGLYIGEYSLPLFKNAGNVHICDHCLTQTPNGAFCFAEEKIETLENVGDIYVFNWNRSYPSDVSFGFDLAENGFFLDFTEEFSGSSHEKITLDIYKRKDRSEQ